MAKEVAKNEKKKNPVFSRFFKFFRDLKGEFKKIVWPTKKQVINNSLVVLAMIVIVGALIWVLDWVLGLGISNFFRT